MEGNNVLRHIENQISTNISIINRRVRDGSLVVIDDIFCDLAPLPPPYDIFCIDALIPKGTRSAKDLSVSPGMSFRWNAFGLEKFGSSERLRRILETTDAISSFSRYKRKNRTFLYSPPLAPLKEITKLLCRAVDIVSRNSLNASNRKQERNDALSRKLIAAIEQNATKFGLIDLADFLYENTGTRFGLLHLAPSNSTSAPLARTITISTPTAHPANLDNLIDFLGVPHPQKQQDSSEIGRTFSSLPLPHNPASELIVNAGIGGRPLAGFSKFARATKTKQDRHGLRLLIIPIARPLVEREKLLSSGLVAPDLLFTFTEEIKIDSVGQAISCVEAFAYHRFGARRVNLLTSLHPRNIKNGDVFAERGSANAWQFPSFPASLLRHVLQEILYTTSAHSASVRAYDATTQSLQVVEFAGGISGESDATKIPEPIAIKGNQKTSVVIFTFLAAGPSLPYTYIRKILPPLKSEIQTKRGHRTKTVSRVEIPGEYRKAGLEGVLFNRSSTRSEVCFPLLRGRLAFGTLNIEAPYQAAFDSDLSYLELVKNGIESVLTMADQKIDSRWLLASAARSDAIHQLWQYQDSGDFFSASQNKVLDQIFSSRTQFGEGSNDVSPPTLSKLKAEITDWMQSKWQDGLLRDALTMVKFDSLSAHQINESFYRAATIAIRNIVENAVKYGEPKDDLCFIDDRPWFGARSVKALRIYYRSTNRTTKYISDRLGKTPIENSATRRISFGMYNVGLLTRLLGGSLYVGQHPISLSLIVEIHLPYPIHGDD